MRCIDRLGRRSYRFECGGDGYKPHRREGKSCDVVSGIYRCQIIAACAARPVGVCGGGHCNAGARGGWNACGKDGYVRCITPYGTIPHRNSIEDVAGCILATNDSGCDCLTARTIGNGLELSQGFGRVATGSDDFDQRPAPCCNRITGIGGWSSASGQSSNRSKSGVAA